GKAASSILLVLGYYASSGGYGVWLARKTGVSATRAAGIILYVMTCDLVAVCVVASTAMAFGHIEHPRWLFRVLVGIGAVQTLLILLRPFGRRVPEIFAPWSEVPRGLAVLQILGRCGNILLAVGASWAGARAFGMPVPFHAMATYGPVILLVGSLPVSVA